MNVVLASALAVGIALTSTAGAAPAPSTASTASVSSVTAVKAAAVTPAKPVVKPVTAIKPVVKPVAKPVVKVPAKPAVPAKPIVKKPAVPAKPPVKAPLYPGLIAPTVAMQAEAWDNFSSDSFTTDDLAKGFGATYLGTTTNTDRFPTNHDWYFEDSVSKPGVYHVFELTFK